MKDVKGQSMESYLEEGLLALYPLYDDDDKTAVLTRACRHTDQRSTVWLVRKLASHYNLDLISLRRECGGILKIRHNLVLPFTSSLVLLPVKVRLAAIPGETTNGFVNLFEIKSLEPASSADSADKTGAAGPWLSRIVFENGALLETFNTVYTLNKRREHGKTLVETFTGKSWQCRCDSSARQDEALRFLQQCAFDPDELYLACLKLHLQKLTVEMGLK